MIRRSVLVALVVFVVFLLCGCSRGNKQEKASKSGGSSGSGTVTGDDIEVPEKLSPHLIHPDSLVYEGAFRLPEGSNGSSWEYSGEAATYCPSGDPNGPDDGYPGSIFAVGHDLEQRVSEIDVPVPVVTSKKDLGELNSASTLQPFQDITAGKFGELELPVAGLEYLPPLGNQESGKLHFTWGEHFHEKQTPSHGWSELNLSSPKPAGLWYLGDYTNYTISDYLFEIPKNWADANTPGLRLATGRFREGLWSGYGPALFAYKPWDKEAPPSAKKRLREVEPLLLYGTHRKGNPEIDVSGAKKMKIFKETDNWSGGAWLAAGEKSAVIFVGTKATGKSWYGFANGVEYPTDDESGEDIPETPPWPYDDRGWWSEGIKAQIIFYDPADLAKVAKGEIKSWEPQPYASLDINKYMFDPGFDHERGKRQTVEAVSFDRKRGILYIFERRADDDKSIVHVFRIKARQD